MAIERIILVRARTRLEKLKERFGTASQAEFYLKQSAEVARDKKAARLSKAAGLDRFNIQAAGFSLLKAKKSDAASVMKSSGSEEYDRYAYENERLNQARDRVLEALQDLVPVKEVERDLVPNYLFAPNELIVVLGQDGLVANTAKYSAGQPIVAVNPAPDLYDGHLLPFQLEGVRRNVQHVLDGRYRTRDYTLAQAELSDGQRLLAFNDLFIGPRTHVSARYRLSYDGRTEAQSSSGLIVSTGAGSTGWLSSMVTMAAGISGQLSGGKSGAATVQLAPDARELVFAVREPFVSRTSAASLVYGRLDAERQLEIESEMPQHGIIFSDGVEADLLQFNAGTVATIGIAPEVARMVVPA